MFHDQQLKNDLMTVRVSSEDGGDQNHLCMFFSTWNLSSAVVFVAVDLKDE